ncbi:hypothetical protein V3Q77_08350 [Flavobacterium davisii]|uniref:Uncharacterized protein n=1 Tax=Flavobacterium davisii TaxID=2906077 RepID=A0ABW8PQ47_9FLAO
MAINLEDIGGTPCEPVGGTSGKIYYALLSDFATVAQPKNICDANPANAGADFDDLSTIATNHVFKQGKCFKTIDCILETISLESKQIGETGRHLFENTMKFEVADSNEKVLGFARFIKNQNVIVLFEEFGSGRLRQLGSGRLPARAKDFTQLLEAKVEGKNSLSGTFYDKNLGVAPIYKGDLLLTPQP